MSAEQLVPSVVSCNLEPPIWTMKNKEDKVNLEKTVDRMSDGSSAEESEEVEPEPPPAAVRRKVSFADAFGLDLVSVKEYDCRDSSGPQVDGREGKEYHISCLFTVPALIQDMEEKLQQQKLELERIELLHGSTTIRGIVRVLNLSFHKAVYVRATLDGWQSHFDLQAEYVPGSSDGETDCFSFHLVLTPPFQVEGVRVEFCLRYESAVGTFWANNGGTNYIVFFHQRWRSDLKDSEKEKEEESNHKGIRSCLKTISKKIYTQATPAEASGEISEQVIPMVGRTRENKTEEEAGTSFCKPLKDCCKTLGDRRRKRQAARLAHVQDYFAKKAMETQRGCNSNTDESNTSISKLSKPSSSHLPVDHSQQGYSMDTPPIVMYHQIPLLPLDWGSTTAASPHANPLDADSKTTKQVGDHLYESTSYTWDASINGSDSTNSHNDMQDQARVPTESLGQSDVLSSKENFVVTLEDKEAEKDCSQVSADRRAMEIIKSDPTEQSKDLSTSPSSDQVVDYKLRKEPRVTTVPCSVLGSKPERVGRESEASCDHQPPHDEHTESLSQAMTKASPGEETQTSPNTEAKNSEVRDEISTEECTGSFDTSKVKENTHRVVKDTLTFTGIRDVPLTNRQAEGSSSDRKDINTDDSEEQVEMRQFYTELHEGDTESSRKGQDETTMDHSTEIQSVSSCESEAFNENELCTSNKNLNKDNSEVQKNEERWFEANEGLKIKERLNETAIEAAKEGEEDEMCSETERELEENSRAVRDNCTDEEKKQPLKATHATHLDIYPRVSIDPSKHLLQATWVVTSPEDDFDLGKTVQNFQEHLDGEDELPTPLSSIHLSWVGGNSSRVLSWWQEFGSLDHMTKTLVYAILFVIFITAYLYDMPTCLALYLFSLFWWCSKGLKQRLDGESVDVD